MKMPDELWAETLATLGPIPDNNKRVTHIAEAAFYMGVCNTLAFVTSLKDLSTDEERVAAYMAFDRRIDEIRAEFQKRTD